MKIPNLRQMLRNTKEHPGRNRLAQSVVEKVEPQVNPFSKNGRGLLAEVKGKLSSVTPTLESEDKDLTVKLVDELSRVIEGEVHFDTSYKAMYSTDASNYRQIPVGVVLVRSADDMIRTVEICRKYRVPVLSRGGGTSLCGQCCNAAVVMDTSKYFNRILELNYEEKYARVQPGVVLDTLRNRAEEKHLTFAPDPSTHNHCTLGGMIGNNSCGTHSVMGGVTADNVYELDVLLYDGTRMTVGKTSDEEYARIIAAGGRKAEIYKKLRNFVDKYADLIRAKFPKLKRRVSGYDLTALLPENGFDIARALVGSESTLVTVLEARVRLVPSPRKRSVVVLGYPDIFSAGDHVPEIMKFGPIALEGLDDLLTSYMKRKNLHNQNLTLLPKGRGWLVAEFGGDTQKEADDKAKSMIKKLSTVKEPPEMKLYDNKEAELEIWKVRESGLGGTARVPGMKDTWEGWEDSAVPPENLGKYLRDVRKLFEKYGYEEVSLYGHFGQGCLHCRVPFDVKTVDGIQKWRRFMDEAAHLVVSYGGSISGEHGDGQSKAELLPIMFGDEMIRGFEEFKEIWDPDWMMNPGKVVKPNRITQNLRLGPDYSPWEPDTHFRFPGDGNSFSRATTKCVGVGECRRLEGGTMCPSYMATREEKHSTRGRAHMLFEMLQGDPVTGGWKNEQVKEALDLCLSCKGCKSDCPMNVDMATMKSEFLSHYYERKLRPRHAFAFGLIHIWARVAAHVPNICNFFSQTRGLSSVAKFAANVDQSRKIPKFASQTFKQWFKERPEVNLGKPDVVLFPDTFNDHFHPDVCIAAVEVLEDAGFHVIVPAPDMCCGRPLYDYGMLNLAKRWLREALLILKPYIEGGMPIVFLEPSCAAVFKDELPELMPADEDGKRLQKQVYPFSQFIVDRAPDYKIPPLRQKVLLQVHCHHKSVLTRKDHAELFERMQAEVEIPEPGCCGMAGAFGYEAENGHCDVSKKIGEERLLPAVNQLPKNRLVIADGFSCRGQIEQGSDRQAVHTAQAIKLALQDVSAFVPYPEKQVLANDKKIRFTTTEKSLGAIVALLLSFLAVRQFTGSRAHERKSADG